MDNALKMIVDGDVRRRLIKEGRQYFAYRHKRKQAAQTPACAAVSLPERHYTSD